MLDRHSGAYRDRRERSDRETLLDVTNVGEPVAVSARGSAVLAKTADDTLQ
jgi:hypothetical protein